MLLWAGALLAAGCEPESGGEAAKQPVAARAGVETTAHLAAGTYPRPTFAHDNIVLLATPPSLPDGFEDHLDAVYEKYGEVVAALATGDLRATATAAEAMAALLDTRNDFEMRGDADEAWVNHREVFAAALDQVQEAESIDESRVHFNHLSKVMFCALASFGGGSQTQLYSCPRALEGSGGYWVGGENGPNPYPDASPEPCRRIEHEL